MFSRIRRSQLGQGMTEYIIIVALVAIAAIAAVSLFGGRIKTLFGKSTEALGSEEVVEEEGATLKDFDAGE